MGTLSLAEIQEKLLDGSLTCRRIVDTYLSRIEASKHLNAYVEVYAEEVIRQADILDGKIKNKRTELGRLFGCVFSVKDMIVLENHGVTAGSRILEGFKSRFTATCLQRMLDEDAIVIGRTNCDEFGMGSANLHSHYGSVGNAVDPERVSGGSSGGAAVSVQAGTCLVALGTDTGGSVRQPAAMTGTFGFKPTYGMVSRYGLIAYASSFDQLGVIAGRAEDVDRVMDVVSSVDPHDGTMLQRGLYGSQLTEKKETYRLAWFPEAVETDGIDDEVRDRFSSFRAYLSRQGHTVEPVGFDLLDYLVPCYYILTTAEASSNLSRYDGVKYGYRSKKAKNINDLYVMSRSEGFGSEVKKRIMLGSFVLSEGYYDAYFSKAQKVRTLVRNRLQEIFGGFDFIVLPTSPVAAWKKSEKAENPLSEYMADIYTVLASLAGMPAISVPSGNNSGGLPLGIQLIAPAGSDKKLVGFCKDITDWHNI